MKSVAIKSAKELEIKEIEEPKANGKDVVFKVKRAGICGSDIHNYENGAPVGLVMGHEFSGEVIDPGDRTDLHVGDRITALPISPCGKCSACLTGNPQYCNETWNHALGLSLDAQGTYTSISKFRSDMVFKLPANVDNDEGAMVEPTAVGLHAIHLADIKVGDTVLVVGGGIIGLVSAMFAKMEGASLVVVSETNPYRGKKAVELGVADSWLDAKDEKFLEKVYGISNGGFDKVIECCGNSAAVSSSIMCTKNGGKIVLVGVSAAPITIPAVVAVMHEITLKGAIAYTKEEFQTCIDLISNKKIDVKKFVSKTIGLDDVNQAFADLYSGESELIKVLIDPTK